MPKSKLEYRNGRIVWANLRTATGRREEHPAVILSPDSEIIQPEDFDPRKGGDNIVIVAGISTKYRNHSHPYVRLPFNPTPQGHSITGLRKDCAAIVGWYQALFLEDDIVALAGDVPPAELREFSEKIFAHYVAKVTGQYATSLEMLADLRQTLIDRELSGE